ncbi:hypothetical protein AB9P05_06460 [Roseivirga sp. BDSF3-8]|uniref:hypothetical protein n=1 Tax=Roseivirga sp. BDSF3-8 TaxID=3241598 RepID=UPI00353207ED
MERKFFPLDKNYILRDAQRQQKQHLLAKTVGLVRQRYFDYYNPLGLIDDTVMRIKAYEVEGANLSFLDEFYETLSGIYRYQFGSNQLELLFDGASHQQKYETDWEQGYTAWLEEFCMKKSFLTAVFEATVFAPEDNAMHMVGRRLKVFLKQYFDINVCHRKGFPVLKSA